MTEVPIIFNCRYSLLVSGLRHTAALVFRPFTKRSALTGVENITASSLGPSESVMISKDSGSSVSSVATEDNQSEVFLDAIESSSVMDEKWQWNGFEKENDQLEEWLEDSLIEGDNNIRFRKEKEISFPAMHHRNMPHSNT